MKKRKLAEGIFDWSKTIGMLRKARFVGLEKVRAQTTFIRCLRADGHGDDLWLAFAGSGEIAGRKALKKYQKSA